MKRVMRLTERDLTRIVRRIVNEGDGFKSNKKEDKELDFERKLDDIFFREDEGNLFSEPGQFGYLSSQHSLSKKVSPRQRAERIDQVINLLKNYIRDLEGSKSGALGFADNPDYDSVWSSLENDEDMDDNQTSKYTSYGKPSKYDPQYSQDPRERYDHGGSQSGH